MKNSVWFTSSILLLMAVATQSLHAQPGRTIELFVAPGGNPGNPGTLGSPFPSLADALVAIAKIDGALNATVYLRKGEYGFSKSLVLVTDADSSRHIVLSGYKNERVVFTGGARIQNSTCEPVNDPATLDRLLPSARGKVYKTDLKALGITDYGKDLAHGYKKHYPANLELFYNEKPLTNARWPNTGLMPIGPVVDRGSRLRNGDKDNRGAKFVFANDRINNWKYAGNAWIGGLLSYGYSDDYLKVDTIDPVSQTIRLKDPAEYGVFATADASTDPLKNSQALRGFYIFNLLEEIDTPGEWYMDKQAGILYFWPPDDRIGSADIEVSILEEPILVLERSENVTIRNIIFQYSRGMAILAENTRHTVIENCAFQNLGTIAISTGDQVAPWRRHYSPNGDGAQNVAYNTDLSIRSCVIRNTGSGGIMMDGGDRRNLLPAGNGITNCEIVNFSRRDKTYSPAINMNGVGNYIKHCYIHDAPDVAIIFYGNDHEISYNHVENVTYNVTDAGAVSTGRDLGTAGNTIAFNFFDNIRNDLNNSVAAVYLDDGTSGTHVNSNIFYASGTPGTYHFGAVHVNGGSNNVFNNNYFINCAQAFSNTQWNDKQWRDFITNASIAQAFRPGVDIHSSAYLAKYPHLALLADSVNIASRMNISYNTIAYNVGVFSAGAGYTHNNVLATKDDPGFKDLSKPDLSITRRPVAFQNDPEWSPIPFHEIGIQPNKQYQYPAK